MDTNYPAIDKKDIKYYYYRHPIYEFSFTAPGWKGEMDGIHVHQERLRKYGCRATLNGYVPAVDQIPADLDFSVPQLSQSFGLSEDLQRHNLSRSNQPDSQSQGNSQQSTGGGARDSTPNTSFTGRGAPKRPRKRLAEGQ